MTIESIRKVLLDIQSRIPEGLRKSVVTYVEATPTMKMVMEHAASMESISQEKRDNIKKLLDAGEFSKVKPVENLKVAKQIDNFVSREINKAIKEGRLPKKRELNRLLKEQDDKRRKESASSGVNPK